METICLFVTVGLVMAILFVGIGVCIGRMDKGESDKHNSMDVCECEHDNNCRNMGVSDLDAEEVINGLQTIRMSLSAQEKVYLDYACECVEKIDRLDKYMSGF